MTTDEMLSTLAAALAEDTGILAWSNDQFGTAPTVWVHVDADSPPGESDYPVIAIVDVAEIHGNAANRRSWGVTIGCGVVNTARTTAGAMIAYTGFLQAEQLRERVEAAVKACGLGKIDFKGETAADNDFPIFVSFTAFTIEIHNSRRR